jgi:hypothetical protein
MDDWGLAFIILYMRRMYSPIMPMLNKIIPPVNVMLTTIPVNPTCTWKNIFLIRKNIPTRKDIADDVIPKNVINLNRKALYPKTRL